MADGGVVGSGEIITRLHEFTASGDLKWSKHRVMQPDSEEFRARRGKTTFVLHVLREMLYLRIRHKGGSLQQIAQVQYEFWGDRPLSLLFMSARAAALGISDAVAGAIKDLK